MLEKSASVLKKKSPEVLTPHREFKGRNAEAGGGRRDSSGQHANLRADGLFLRSAAECAYAENSNAYSRFSGRMRQCGCSMLSNGREKEREL